MKAPPPSIQDRAAAATAARALRAALTDTSTMGERCVAHIDLCRPRRGVWIESWANLPGFSRTTSGVTASYAHELLPGWEYSRGEVAIEMIPDLEALAERGVRPTEATKPSDQGRLFA